MHQPMKNAAMMIAATTNTGANGEVNEVSQILAAPQRASPSAAASTSVSNPDWHAQSITHGARPDCNSAIPPSAWR